MILNFYTSDGFFNNGEKRNIQQKISSLEKTNTIPYINIKEKSKVHFIKTISSHAVHTLIIKDNPTTLSFSSLSKTNIQKTSLSHLIIEDNPTTLSFSSLSKTNIQKTSLSHLISKNIVSNFINVMKQDISKARINEREKENLFKNLSYLSTQKVNIMITGATGSGKSSTINALFGTEKAKIGVGVDPETMDIQKYELDNLVLWDTPGLGDGKEADKKHTQNIINKLHEKESNGKFLINLVLVLINGRTRDLGTSYDLINNVIIPNLGKNKKNRIVIALNQCDIAMKGRYWNYEGNYPEHKLKEFLEEKTLSIKTRIKEATGLTTEPVYYKAGFKEEGKLQEQSYNLSSLIYYLVNSISHN